MLDPQVNVKRKIGESTRRYASLEDAKLEVIEASEAWDKKDKEFNLGNKRKAFEVVKMAMMNRSIWRMVCWAVGGLSSTEER